MLSFNDLSPANLHASESYGCLDIDKRLKKVVVGHCCAVELYCGKRQ